MKNAKFFFEEKIFFSNFSPKFRHGIFDTMASKKKRRIKDMLIQADKRGNTLYVHLQGEMDEHSAVQARRDADRLADSFALGERAVFDLQNVSFMDSTGIGFLIGRYKKFQRYGIPMYVTNPSQSTDKILSISGVYALIPRI